MLNTFHRISLSCKSISLQMQSISFPGRVEGLIVLKGNRGYVMAGEVLKRGRQLLSLRSMITTRVLKVHCLPNYVSLLD